MAVYLACFRDCSASLAPGEVATVMLIAADRKQARVVTCYVMGFLEGVPMLLELITRHTRETAELSNRVVIEVHTASFRSTRGYSLAAVVADELAFWRSEDSANPDVGILNALRPGLATIPGSLLLCISSPYARRGALWDTHRKHFGKDKDPVLVWQSDTRSMNPTVPEEVIAQAYEEDPAAAAAEYGAEFRRDVETFVSHETIDAVTIPGRAAHREQAGEESGEQQGQRDSLLAQTNVRYEAMTRYSALSGLKSVCNSGKPADFRHSASCSNRNG